MPVTIVAEDSPKGVLMAVRCWRFEFGRLRLRFSPEFGRVSKTATGVE